MQIHLARNGQAMGPFPLEEVNRQLAAGTLTGTDLAWYDGAAGWAPLSSVPGVTVPGTSGATPPAPGTPAPSAAPATLSPAATVAAPPAFPVTPAAPTEPLAIWSFVLSLVGLFGFLCCGPLFSGAAVVCGHLALPKFRARPDLQGRGLAVAGLVIGYVLVGLWVFWILVGGGLAVLQGILESSKK
jgi:hypothetical protein